MKIVTLEHQNQSISLEIRNVLFEAYSLEAQLIGVDQFPPLSRSPSDIASSPNQFIGAVENGNLLGVVELECRNDSDDSVGISSLCVAPRYARKGVGSALLKYALSFGVALVEVSTASANGPAIALYEKMGFMLVRSETNRHGISVVHLERHITV